MARVTITIEDIGADDLTVTTDYGDAFHKTSNAHQYGNMVAQQLDRWLERRGPETVIGDAPSGRAPDKPEDQQTAPAIDLKACASPALVPHHPI